MSRKHIIITKLFEFGGSNTHLKTLIKYFGEKDVILLLEDQSQLNYLETLGFSSELKVKITSNLLGYAHLRYRFTTNIKEFLHIIRSIIAIQILSIRYGFADITISEVEPEKHLYLLWIPFSKIRYILHTTPNRRYTSFTSFTCNSVLSKRKRIITVSNSNKLLICENWDISNKKKMFVEVIYNCIIESKSNDRQKALQINNKQLIVTMGHVIGYKNPSQWLQVAKIITSMRENVQFIWFGNGPLLYQLQEATKGAKRIIFKGLVSNTGIWLKEAIIYYQPSLNETHGIAVVEAMYNYLPCVVSNVGGLPESVNDKFNGLLVHPTKTSDHVDAILKLVDDPQLRRQYSLNGHRRYNELFTFEVFKARMDNIYRN
jgi:glycosyltransferase involved in cell wall biosynthesis